MGDKATINVLNQLIRTTKDGEEGFRVASENVRNRGLKAVFKSFAQSRRDFTKELQEEVSRLDRKPRDTGSLLAGFHRGWINIKAAMTIDPQKTEEVVLAEVSRGENEALRRYRLALAQSVSPETLELIRRQYKRLQEINDQIQQLKGNSGNRVVIRLFDRPEDANKAVRELKKQGFSDEAISRINMSDAITLYQSEGLHHTVSESAGVGMFVGTLLGIFIGLVTGLGAAFVPNMNLGMEPTFSEALFSGLLLGAGAGAIIGGIIGALIGKGVSEEDAFLYADSIAHGSILLSVETKISQADEASLVMFQVNAARNQ